MLKEIMLKILGAICLGMFGLLALMLMCYVPDPQLESAARQYLILSIIFAISGTVLLSKGINLGDERIRKQRRQ
jgi:hypothetical protein